MKFLLVLFLLKAVQASPNSTFDLERTRNHQYSPLFDQLSPPTAKLDCSYVQNGTTCDCNPTARTLSCRNVTQYDALLPVLSHLLSLTRLPYWSTLEVTCPVNSDFYISSTLLTGELSFESVTFVGNCKQSEYYGTESDDETLVMRLEENTLPLKSYFGFAAIRMTRLAELTLRESSFGSNQIKSEFSSRCEVTTGCRNELQPLRKLTITSCNVSLIESGAFRNFPHLELIDLSGNQLSRLSRSVFSPSLTNLRTLKLEANQLTSLEAGFFDGLPQLREVNLSGNRMRTLPFFMTSSRIVQVFHLAENPWSCRCPLSWILRQPRFGRFLADQARCQGPEWVQGKALLEGLTLVERTFC